MKKKKIRELLVELKNENVSVEQVMEKLKDLPFQDLNYVKIDHHRDLRRGAPEAIFCEGKTEEQVLEIIDKMKPHNNVLATRVEEKVLARIKERYSDAHVYPQSKLAFIGSFPEETTGKVSIITAGTTDIPVARKSEITVRSMGVETDTIFDVGVSGLHRVIDFREEITSSDIAVVVAGMEGALPSVLAGLVDTPIVAVPTNVGYGANLKGIAPLLTMLNSCAPGITVVNVGDGYGAGYFAAATVKKIRNNHCKCTED